MIRGQNLALVAILQKYKTDGDENLEGPSTPSAGRTGKRGTAIDALCLALLTDA